MEVGVLRDMFWCLCLVISGGVVYVAFVVSTGVCVCNVFVIGAVLVYGILESPPSASSSPAFLLYIVASCIVAVTAVAFPVRFSLVANLIMHLFHLV